MSSQTQPSQSTFDKYLQEQLQIPGVRAGFEDQGLLQRVIDRLIGFRKALGLTQTEVARRMGVGQPTVSGFETEMSDPRLSTLQRYARAVEARLEVNVVWDATCDWVDTSSKAYAVARVQSPKATQVHRRSAKWPANPYSLAA